ncbi:hypothetical protein N657DRAFT_50580 [Parathielavia appendiculata]|uniref:Uncharacterized protein n=1 Tax=Parathielavia appendiculata TaxID=2587402 RepID=A0AAN6U9U8_9PEZI|nr:hypothetical protein N657DRAFT_50580 [Parathielavia appendiculata]
MTRRAKDASDQAARRCKFESTTGSKRVECGRQVKQGKVPDAACKRVGPFSSPGNGIPNSLGFAIVARSIWEFGSVAGRESWRRDVISGAVRRPTRRVGFTHAKRGSATNSRLSSSLKRSAVFYCMLELNCDEVSSLKTSDLPSAPINLLSHAGHRHPKSSNSQFGLSGIVSARFVQLSRAFCTEQIVPKCIRPKA